MNTVIGSKIKAYRKQKGWSQEYVAEILHLSQSAYSRIENGDSNSWVNHLEKICEVFEVTPEELIKNESIILSNNQQGGTSTNALVINQLSEKLIEQYELRLKEKDELIDELKIRLKNTK
jgi:transcriptional regulator with XRE-family HTH domain